MKNAKEKHMKIYLSEVRLHARTHTLTHSNFLEEFVTKNKLK